MKRPVTPTAYPSASASAAGLAAIDLLGALVLEDGRPWGQAAHPFQRRDAERIIDRSPGAPRRHYLLRGRGMSKTTDVAAVALAMLLTEAPRRSSSLIFASDQEQAQLFADALAGLVGRTPGLAAAVDVQARGIEIRATGARLTVQSSDSASAYGARPWLTIADELALWPSHTNYRRLWAALISAVPKVPGSRLVVITTAGSPTGLGAEVWAEAEKSPHWSTSLNPGPSPWWSAADIESLKADLSPAQWRRLILCEWAEGDDALTTPEDVAAAIRGGSTVTPPRPGIEYVAALDVGTRRDLTALVVGHLERGDAGRVVHIDRVLSWKPAKGERVDLQEVEAAALRLCREYGVSRLRFDRMQAEQLSQNLSRQGVRVDEYVFSAAGANKLARSLFTALRDRALSLPDDTETREEFLAVRLVETGPATVKLSNPPGTHDDIVTAVGMAVATLLERPDHLPARAIVPRGPRLPSRPYRDPSDLLVAGRSTPALPTRLRVTEAARQAPARGLNALLVPGSANDPRRR